jgi:hypothetical protein
MVLNESPSKDSFDNSNTTEFPEFLKIRMPFSVMQKFVDIVDE